MRSREVTIWDVIGNVGPLCDVMRNENPLKYCRGSGDLLFFFFFLFSSPHSVLPRPFPPIIFRGPVPITPLVSRPPARRPPAQ